MSSGWGPPGGGGGFGSPPAGGGFGGEGGGTPPGGGFGSPPGGGFGAPPGGQPAGGAAAGPPGPSMPGRPAEVSEIFDNFKLLFGRLKGGFIGAYLVLSLANVLVQAPTWIVTYLQQEALESGNFSDLGTYSLLTICTSFFQIGVSLVIGAVMLGLYRPIRMALVQGPEALGGTGALLKLAYTGFLPKLGIMLVVGIAIGIGLVLCIVPGVLAAYFLCLAAYLVAAVDQPIGDAIRRSIELAKTNLVPLIVAIVVYVVVIGVATGIGATLGAVLTATLGAIGLLVAQPIAALVGVAVGYVGFVFFGAVAVTVETADSGTPLLR